MTAPVCFHGYHWIGNVPIPPVHRTEHLKVRPTSSLLTLDLRSSKAEKQQKQNQTSTQEDAQNLTPDAQLTKEIHTLGSHHKTTNIREGQDSMFHSHVHPPSLTSPVGMYSNEKYLDRPSQDAEFKRTTIYMIKYFKEFKDNSSLNLKWTGISSRVKSKKQI